MTRWCWALIDAQDTDGDGLTDGQEGYHQDKSDSDLDNDRSNGSAACVCLTNQCKNEQESAWVTSDPEKVDTAWRWPHRPRRVSVRVQPNVWPTMRFSRLTRSCWNPPPRATANRRVVRPRVDPLLHGEVTNELLDRYMQRLLGSSFPAAENLPLCLRALRAAAHPAQTLRQVGVSATALPGFTARP